MIERPGLTPLQEKLLRFIETRLLETRVSPSFEEMKAHMGCGGKSGIHRLVTELVDRGYITRVPRRVRTLALASPLSKVPVYMLMAELKSRGIPVKVEVK